MRIDARLKNYVRSHPIRTGFILAAAGALYYFNFFPWIYRSLVYGEPIMKKLRRWIIDENNLPDLSITEWRDSPINKEHILSNENKYILKLLFTKMSSDFYFGLSYKMLDQLMNHLNVYSDEKERNKFLRLSGFGQNRNQMMASMTLEQFYDNLEEIFTQVKQNSNETSLINQDEFVDSVRSFFISNLKSFEEWEKEAIIKINELIKYHSFAKGFKMETMIAITLKNNNEITLEELDREMTSKGMQLSIQERLNFLVFKKSSLEGKIQGLITQQKTYEEYGAGENRTEQIHAIKQMKSKIEEQILIETQKYKKIFPKSDEIDGILEVV